MDGLRAVLTAVTPSSPVLAGAVLLLLGGAFALGFLGRRGAPRRVAFAAVADLPSGGRPRARLARAVRLLCLAALIGTTAFLWSELTTASVGDGVATPEALPARTLLAVFDISSSMATPFGGGVDGSRFTVAQEALAAFLLEQVDALATERERLQAGVIFFSSDVLDFRRPTRDVAELVDDLRRLDITRESGDQLAELSWGTETARALSHASSMLGSLDLPNLRSGAVILVSDLLDDRLELAEAINALTDRSIRVYILSIEGRGAEPSAAVADALALNPQVFAFHIRVPEDMRDVYTAIGELEGERASARMPAPLRTRATHGAVLALVAIALAYAFISEALLPRVRSAS